jgi:glycosyltransferase involved in cell wall biosynthesis
MKSADSKAARDCPKVLIVHPDLSNGGAERQLVQFLKYYDRQKLDIILVLYKFSGPLAIEVKKISDQRVISLPVPVSVIGLGRICGLWRVCVREKPDILYSLLENTNIVSCVVAKLTPIRTLAWGLRISSLVLSGKGKTKALISRWLERHLSRRVNLLVANNSRGLAEFIADGFSPKSTIVIRNGIDVDYFRYNEEYRSSIRNELGLEDNVIVISQIARVVEWKGYSDLIGAIQLLDVSPQKVVFLCVGTGLPELVARYKEQAENSSAKVKIYWLGDRQDVVRILCGSDIFTLASTSGEGFSNALAEAMAVKRPVVATDVGDAKDIVGEGGIVVPPRDIASLAGAWNYLISNRMAAENMGRVARQRVIERFSIQRSVSQTEEALVAVLNRAGSG